MKSQGRVARLLSGRLANTNIARWLNKGAWAITDQVLFAVSNFALNIMLARWLSTSDYGAFVSAYAIFLLLSGVHNSLIVEPMFVFSAGRYAGSFNAYLRRVTRYHWGLVALLALPGLLLGVGARYGFMGGGVTAIFEAFAVISLAAPFILFYWLVRRACYSRHAAPVAVTGSVLYLGIMLAGLYSLNALSLLSVSSAMLTVALAAFVAACGTAVRLGLAAKQQPLTDVNLFKEHWEYGRWVIATTFANWIPSNLFYMILPVWAGLEASGALRAMSLPVMPVGNLFVALALLLTPNLVARRGSVRFWHLVTKGIALFSAIGLLYFVFIALFRVQIADLLYGDKFAAYVVLMVILGLKPILAGATTVLTNAMRALERPDLEFRAYLVATGVTLTVGLAAVRWLGAFGAASAMVAASLGTLIGAGIIVGRLYKRNVN